MSEDKTKPEMQKVPNHVKFTSAGGRCVAVSRDAVGVSGGDNGTALLREELKAIDLFMEALALLPATIEVPARDREEEETA